MNSRQDTDMTTGLSSELAIINLLDDLVSVVDDSYHYRAVSKGYTNFFGCKQSDIVGKHVAQVHGTENFEQHIKEGLDKALAGEDVHLQFWRPNHDGDLRFLDSKHTPYSGPLTEGKGIVVVARDVTELIRSQDALEKEKSLLNTVINAVPDIIFVKDLKGTYQLCNTSFEEFLGISSEQIIGKTDNELMSEASAQYIAAQDKRVTNSHTPQRCDEWVTYKDGRERLLDMYKLPLIDKQQALSGLLGIGRNVTFERETEQKQLMAALMFETTPDPCLIVSGEGQIISSNAAAKNQFSRQLNDTQAKIRFSDIFYSPGKSLRTIKEMLEKDDCWQGEICTTDHSTFMATINAVHEATGRLTKYVVIIRNEHSRHQLTEALMAKAYHDSLTGLPNRLLFQSRLESAITRSERQFRKIAVLFIDLNKFKPVNDQFGHTAGDQVLIDIAQRLQENFRATDTLARIGGDEFVALIDIEHRDTAAVVADKIVHSLSQPFHIDNNEINVGASIGISIFPSDAGSADDLLQKADEAMYKAKRDPRLSYAYYTKE
ncbi:diguanylate cyclase domain-containing protein [Amphritea sp. HPY]|uniref:PAS domain-containing protein n=1 Tax=Amphritea sp. HPY TaxID=3421652 RepID=UPI003D7E8F88